MSQYCNIFTQIHKQICHKRPQTIKSERPKLKMQGPLRKNRKNRSENTKTAWPRLWRQGGPKEGIEPKLGPVDGSGPPIAHTPLVSAKQPRCTFKGQALAGQAFVGPPWALMGRAFVGNPGPLRAPFGLSWTKYWVLPGYIQAPPHRASLRTPYAPGGLVATTTSDIGSYMKYIDIHIYSYIYISGRRVVVGGRSCVTLV